MPYDATGVLPDALCREFDDGTNLLLSGPAMSGKRTTLLDLVARGERDGDGSVLVTSRDPAEEIVEEYEAALDDRSAFLHIVDCVSTQSGSATAAAGVHHVSSPGDLTGIGIEFSGVAEDAAEAGFDRLRVGFDSLSPLLMYVDLQRLFRFLHVFTSQIQSQGWLGVFSVDPESHDAQTVNTISQLFDGVLEVRVPDDGGREGRLRGVTDTPTEWVSMA
jgi:KaiC/GvpD/RAD55 family RecA-like ATPase